MISYEYNLYERECVSMHATFLLPLMKEAVPNGHPF